MASIDDFSGATPNDPDIPASNIWGSKKPPAKVGGSVNTWGTTTARDKIQWVLDHPDFRFKPATIMEFLGPGYLDLDIDQNPKLDPRAKVRPGLKKALVEIFGEEIDPLRISKMRRALFTGGIGIGKTTLASIALTYMVHWVSCLDNPQKYFGLLPGSRIAFMLMSTKGTQTNEVLFADIKARVHASLWFQKYALPNQDSKIRTNQLRFPRDIWIIPGNSQETTFEGYNVLAGILDEGDSHKVTETKDYAAAGWDTIENRISSRFTDLITGDHLGLIIAIGQMKMSDGFMARKKKELEDEIEKAFRAGREPTSHVNVMTIWESHGWEQYRDPKTGKIPVFYFDSSRRVIVPPGPGSQYADSPNSNIMRIPEAYRKLFEADPVKALRDQAGIPPAVEDPFISMTDRVDAAFDRYEQHHPDIKVPVGSNPFNPTFHPNLRCVTPQKRVIHVDIGYCVDPETEIFTQRGWLRHNEVQVGDMTLGLDENTHLAKWTPVTAVNKFAAPNYMLSIEGKSHSSLSTANHRWFVRQRVAANGSYSGTEPAVVRSENLSGRHSIVSAAPVTDLPDITKYSDAFVELVAWFWTEGNVMLRRDGGMSNYSNISQSHVVNPANVARIRAALTAQYGNPTEAFPRTGKIKPIVPMWREKARDPKGLTEFFLNGVITRELIAVVRGFGKVVAPEFICNLTKAQLELFIHVSELADGSAPGIIAQGWHKRLDSMQMAYVLSGRRTNLTVREDGSGNLCALASDAMKINPNNKRWIKSPCDTVWCPTTGTGSWLARRNGTTYFTGNSSNGDCGALAMGYIKEVVDIDGEWKPYIVFDMLMRIMPRGGEDLMLKVFRDKVITLRDELKYPIKLVSYDGFQSQDSLQILRKQYRFNTAEVSVDRSKGPYEDLREAINEQRIEFPRYMTLYRRADTDKTCVVRKELLELKDMGRKIDHPPRGSKDISDAIAGVVGTLMGNDTYRRGVKRGTGGQTKPVEDDLVPSDLAQYSSPQTTTMTPIDMNFRQDGDELLEHFLAASSAGKRGPMGLPPIERDPFSELNARPRMR